MRLGDSELAKLTPLERIALDTFLLTKWLESAQNARLDVLTDLANDGFSIDAADPDGPTLLLPCSLIRAVTPRSCRAGFTALMVGAAEGRADVVKFLIERKADTRKQTAGVAVPSSEPTYGLMCDCARACATARRAAA
jgi:hypothetical protein